jgi:sigma-B regulation protein RsbU (phosphoserine phosphatase)
MPASNAQHDPAASSQEEIAHLKRAVEELSVLNELARSIGASLDSQQVMHTIILRSLHAINADQGVITLVDKGIDAETTTLVRTQVSTSEQPQFHLAQALVGWMYLNKKPLLLNDPQHDDRFRGTHFDNSIRCIVCVPMMVKSELIGVLTVYNKKVPGGFTEGDQRLLAIIAAQSAQVVENARLYEEERQLQKMKAELRLAAQIQSELLPKECPELSGYDIAAKTIPAEQVGGDYFDFVHSPENDLVLCLGDVSGKGLPAALLMANLQATLRGQAMLTPIPKECLLRANRLLFNSTSAEKFATLFYAVLKPETGDFCYSNAGHERPVILKRNQEVRFLGTGGLPLGMLADWAYEDACEHLHPGDVLVVYSDGIGETVDADGEQFGAERALEVIKSSAHLSAGELVESILAAVRKHAASPTQADDMTLLVVKRLH